MSAPTIDNKILDRKERSVVIHGEKTNDDIIRIQADDAGNLKTNTKLSDENGDPINSDNPLPVSKFNSLVTEPFDYVALTYIESATGETANGENEIETATYKNGGASGTTVAVITLTYNSNNKIESVTKV